MHPEVVEKRSFNGYCQNNNSNNNLTTHSTFFGPTPQSRSSNHLLLVTPPTTHTSLRRSRSASPAPGRKDQQQFGQLLSNEQQALIRKSWLKIPKSSFGRAVFEQMSAACPSAARTFENADPSAIARHVRYYGELAGWAVDACAEPERMLGQWLEMVGRGHAQFGIRRAQWDCLGEAMTDTICQCLPAGRQRRETMHAWRVLFSFLADRLGNSLPAGQGPPSSPRIQLLQLVAEGPIFSEQKNSTP